MIAKHKQETGSTAVKSANIGSAATLALCGSSASGVKTAEIDPWTHNDPWKKFHPATSGAGAPSDGLQQIEERIHQAVLAKIPPAMDQEVPERVSLLEDQVQQLLTKQQHLEVQFHEHSGQQSQQLNALQGQITAQAQQLHGQMENQNQTMQSLFEQQMQQIRGLLAKRPRDDTME